MKIPTNSQDIFFLYLIKKIPKKINIKSDIANYNKKEQIHELFLKAKGVPNSLFFTLSEITGLFNK